MFSLINNSNFLRNRLKFPIPMLALISAIILASHASKMSSQQAIPLSSIKSFPVHAHSSSPSDYHQLLPHQQQPQQQEQQQQRQKPKSKPKRKKQQQKQPKNAKTPGHGLPTIMKIFENPSPNDGYESLRKFSDEMKKGMFPTQLYNTSIALTSALFAFQLPSNSDSVEVTVGHANQVIFGMFAFLTAVLIFALPVLLTGQKFNPDARSNDDGILSRILKTEPLAKLIADGAHKKIGLEPEKCLQKTICQAHRSPNNKRYGMLALPFQMFYPPLSNETEDQSRATSFQEAAYTGKNMHKIRCGKKYNCFFDVLDMARYLLDWYQYHYTGAELQS